MVCKQRTQGADGDEQNEDCQRVGNDIGDALQDQKSISCNKCCIFQSVCRFETLERCRQVLETFGQYDAEKQEHYNAEQGFEPGVKLLFVRLAAFVQYPENDVSEKYRIKCASQQYLSGTGYAAIEQSRIDHIVDNGEKQDAQRREKEICLQKLSGCL